jgi:polysaccharide export outer membrane protein
LRKLFVSLVFVMVIANLAWAAGQNTPPPAAPAPAAPPARNGTSTAAQPAPAAAGVESRYLIGPGDALEISVWKDEALTKDVVVLPDGTISFPLIGLLKAEGKTVAQLKEEIEEKISQYVTEPVLNVEVKQVNSMLIFVIGRLNMMSTMSGRLILNANANVLQALAMTGGLNPFAKRNSIKIFRQEEGKTKIFPFHYDDVVEGKHLEENIQLKRYDVIVVP